MKQNKWNRLMEYLLPLGKTETLGFLTSIYIVYKIDVGKEVIIRWFFTQKGAFNYIKKFGYKHFCVKDVDMFGRTKINSSQAYIDLLLRKKSGKRQEGGLL